MAASDPLKILYSEIAALTEPECSGGCGGREQRPYHCCERKYCEVAREFAWTRYGLELQETGHPELPFMGESGCVVDAYLRPICALHVCGIAYGGGLDEARSKEYYTLRNEIIDEGRRQGKLP